MKKRRLPYFAQKTEYNCGPASMRMALASLGTHRSEADLVKQLKTTSENGTLFKDMIAFVKKLKFSHKTGQNCNFYQLNALLKEGWQVILCYRLLREKSDHFAVVRKISNGRIYLSDPGFGKNHSFSLGHFRIIWKTMDQPDISNKWYLAFRP